MKVISVGKSWVTVLVFLALLSGCADTAKNKDTPDLTITFVEGVDTLKQNSELTVIIETNSSECLQFPSGFGMKYYVFLNNNWEEVPDSGRYVGAPTFQIAKKDGYIPGQMFWMKPNLSGVTITETTRAKAVFTGSYCDDLENKFSKEFEFFIEP